MEFKAAAKGKPEPGVSFGPMARIRLESVSPSLSPLQQSDHLRARRVQKAVLVGIEKTKQTAGQAAAPDRQFSSRSSELTRKPAPSSPALVDPDIDARRLPVVGLVQDVEIAVAVKVGDPGIVKIDSLGEYAGPKVSLAIAVKNLGRGVGVVGLCLLFPPLGHLGGEDVKISIPVDVSKLKAVPVDHRPLAQIPACLGRSIPPHQSVQSSPRCNQRPPTV